MILQVNLKGSPGSFVFASSGFAPDDRFRFFFFFERELLEPGLGLGFRA